jgi:hypothetical protein
MSEKDADRRRNIAPVVSMAMVRVEIAAMIMVAITAAITTTGKVPPIVIPSEARNLSSV